jgi:hypothetical protein
MVTTACHDLQLFYVSFASLMANLSSIFRLIKTNTGKKVA